MIPRHRRSPTLRGDPVKGRDMKAYFDRPLPRVLAHRGLARNATENTLAAFREAVALGAEYIELDVHASRDGTSIVAHDPDLSRLLGRPETVGALTAAELAALDLGHGEGFPSLTEVLDALPAIRLNIDLKSAAAVAPTVAAITAAAATHRVLLTSFSGRRRRPAVRLLPGVATSASASNAVLAVVGCTLGLQPLVRLALRGIDAVQLPERMVGLAVTTPRVLAGIHAAGVEMHIWTINDPQRMTELLALGVDGIITDRADLALPVALHSRLGSE